MFSPTSGEREREKKKSEINSTLIEGACHDRTDRGRTREGGRGKHARQFVGEVDRKRKKREREREKKKSAIKMVMHQVIRA